jgi:hypothetical protein
MLSSPKKTCRKDSGLDLMFVLSTINLKQMITFSLLVLFPKWSGGVLGKALGPDLVPNSFWQAMAWFHNFIPRLEKFPMVILALVV